MALPRDLPARALRECVQLLRLGAPLVVNNLAIAGMGVADTVMAGRIGARDLGAVAVGNSLWIVAVLLAMGTLMALSPLTAHAWGARHVRRAGAQWRQGVWLALLLSVLLLVLLRGTGPLITAVGIDPEIAPLTIGYIHMIAWGAPGLCLYLTLRFVSEGVGRTLPVMIVALFALVVNIFGNWVFMYGNLGAPAMGAVGCGLASALTMWLMLALMLALVAGDRHYRALRLFARIDAPRPRELGRMMWLGVPIAFAMMAEAGLFTVTTLMAGILGSVVVAGHQIAMNYTALMFMVPLALSAATTVRVGQALGKRDPARARFSAWTGIATCTLFMSASAAVMLIAREAVVGLYTDDPAVISVAVSVLLMAALFQVADGAQVGAAGALRGFRDTRVPMALCLVAYWAIGFPLAWYLGLHLALGPAYLWLGLLAGLTVAALLLITRLICINRGSRAPSVADTADPAALPPAYATPASHRPEG